MSYDLVGTLLCLLSLLEKSPLVGYGQGGSKLAEGFQPPSRGILYLISPSCIDARTLALPQSYLGAGRTVLYLVDLGGRHSEPRQYLRR